MVKLLCVLFTVGLSHLYCQEIDDDTLGMFDYKFLPSPIFSDSNIDCLKGYLLPPLPKIRKHDKLSKNAVKYISDSPTRSIAYGSIIKITNTKKRFQLRMGSSQSIRIASLCQKVFLSIDSVKNFDSTTEHLKSLNITLKPDSVTNPFVMWFPVIKKYELSIFSVFKYTKFEYYLYEVKSKSFRVATDYPIPVK